MRTVAILLARIVALVGGLVHLASGAIMAAALAIALGIALFWHGQGQSFALWIGLLVYALGVAALSFLFVVVPKRRLGWLLLLLYLPGVYYVASSQLEQALLRRAVRDYVRAVEAPPMEATGQELKLIERRSGPSVQIHILLGELAQASDDTTRLRIVEVLGRISYQYEPVLVALRGLLMETRADPEREELRDAVLEAIHGVNPYEPLYGPDRDLPLQEAREAEKELEQQLLEEFFDRVDAEIGAISSGSPELAEWDTPVDVPTWIRGGKSRKSLRISYIRSRGDPGRVGGECRLEIIATPLDRPATIPEPYRARSFVRDVASHRVAAWVITELPEVPQLEREILDAIRAAAAEADLVWRSRPSLPAL